MFLWEKIKNIKYWAISNFWNIFSFIGVIATLYLGFFYVPDYVEELGLNKQKIVHQELMADIQELIFYNQPVKLEDIKEIISGKELVYSIKYKFTPPELLNQIQDSFLKNKFIPLEKRNQLIITIKDIRSQYKPPTETSSPNINYTWVILLITSISTVIISTLAIASIISKLRSDIETEVDISSTINMSDTSDNVRYTSDSYQTAHEFELMVGEILDELKINKSIPSERHYDFLINISGFEHIVEVKAFSKLLGLGTAREFVNTVNRENKSGIIVVKSGLTKRALELIDSHNSLTENSKIHVVIGSSRQEVKKSLQDAIKCI
ncbi:hypothetical protein ACETWI_03010 [Aeromonas hydrophila]|uniref:hypothetical protein n=1 Tax=Aeromonas hydrophila TaxID=644 RepID=UPI000A59931F|nr:hypothetical protein [Aeromonas hydrophila]HAT2246762.1 hypothetical protein [Aeromonas hydrophila]HAT2382192.1 hypothetical protein [Aeromonas hydrophila]HAT2413808.1 hypothetical protein [Aeromonas hydrophila]HAT2524566.1 hypothetical protein [Aeromonas hydrophila]HAT2544593.1 hypothetical protein [Aeromonas hydrophila]